MRSYFAFLKKELLDCARGGKLLILVVLFLFVGIMNPAIAKMTPWLMETFADSLADAGVTVTAVEVNAMTSWAQFFKNLPIVWIAFLLMYAGTFTTEYDSQTLILILSKGMPRYRVLLAKTTIMLLVWTLGFWLCFGVTCGYNLYFWEDTIPQNLMSLCIGWWIFGIWTVALVVFFSVALRGYGGVILAVGGSVLIVYLIGLIPKASKWIPTALMNGGSLLLTGECVPYPALILACLTAVALLLQAVPILNKKQL